MSLTVVGCGISKKTISIEALEAIESADMLYGGSRMLEWFSDVPAELLPLTAKLTSELAHLANLSIKKSVVVLASGDALFFGIAKRMLEHEAVGKLRILPGISAMQAACASLQIDWSSASFFTLHGRKNKLDWRRILRSKIAVVYGDNERNPAIIAETLIQQHPGAANRNAYIAQNLGFPSQKFFSGTLKELSQVEVGGLSMLVLGDAQTINETASLPLGLADSDYVHENNLITHPEIRAVVLSKLHLRSGILWDVGAGSGSVGIEAASLSPNLTVYCVEKHPARVNHIQQNIEKQGANNAHVVSGSFNEVYQELPKPDTVFIGGGGRDLGQIVETVWPMLPNGGRLVATAVLADSIEQLNHVGKSRRVDWLELSVRKAHSIGNSSMMKPESPIHIFVFQK